MLKSMLVNKDFQTWHLIDWQHSRQPIRGHVRTSLLINKEFNMDLLSNPDSHWYKDMIVRVTLTVYIDFFPVVY